MLARLRPLTAAARALALRPRVRAAVAAAMVLAPLLLLALLVYHNRQVLAGRDWSALPVHLLAAAGLFSVAFLLAVLTWALILNSVSGPIPFSRHLRHYSLANVARRLPGTVWYVAGRSYLYAREGVGLRAVSLASGIELAVAVASGAVVALMLGAPQLGGGAWRPAMMIAAAVLSLALIHPWTLRRVLRWLKVEAAGDLRYRSLLAWLALYCLIWLLGGAVLFVIAGAVVPLSPRHLPQVIGSWSLAGVASFTVFFLPSNFGVTEVSLSLLLSALMPMPLAVLVAVLARVVLFAFELLWALACLVPGSWRRDGRLPGRDGVVGAD